MIGTLVRYVGPKTGHVYKDFIGGLVVRVFEHKMWRTDARGPSVNWDKVPLEPFVEVLFGENTINLPVGDVEVIGA
jgi:hypothetical protein